MSAPRELWLVRHGATAWTATRQHTGRTDVPLTDDGRREAAALYKPLDRQEFAAAFTSPLVRARETARLAGFADAEVLDDLREWDYGVYEGRTTDDIRAEVPGWSVWNDDIVDGESIEDVAARAARVLAVADRGDGRVVLFAARARAAHPRRVRGRTRPGGRTLDRARRGFDLGAGPRARVPRDPALELDALKRAS